MAPRTAPRRRPWTLAAGTLLLVATSAACGPAPTPVTAPLPLPAPPVVEAAQDPVDPTHAALIEEYWAARERAWEAGLDNGVAFLVDHLHPGLAYSAEECTDAWFGPQPPPGFVERALFEPPSLERDDGWSMTTGPLQDTELDGQLYRMTVAVDYIGAAAHWSARRAEAHLQVIDGQVRNFLRCDVPQITIVTQDAPAPAPTAPTLTPLPGFLEAPTVTLVGPDGSTLAPPIISLPGSLATTAPPPSPAIQPAPIPTSSPTSSPATSPAPTTAPQAPQDAGSREAGTGLDFCLADGNGPSAGGYRICPDDDTPES